MTRSEQLAIFRTELANERTFLAYFRSFIVTLSSGLAILKLEMFKNIQSLGIAFLVLAPILLAIGAFRYFRTKSKMHKDGFD